MWELLRVQIIASCSLQWLLYCNTFVTHFALLTAMRNSTIGVQSWIIWFHSWGVCIYKHWWIETQRMKQLLSVCTYINVWECCRLAAQMPCMHTVVWNASWLLGTSCGLSGQVVLHCDDACMMRHVNVCNREALRHMGTFEWWCNYGYWNWKYPLW